MEIQIIKKEFISLAIMFRAKLSEGQFNSLVELWHGLLEGQEEEKFLAFCKRHMMEGRFFPVPADYFSNEGKKETTALERAIASQPRN